MHNKRKNPHVSIIILNWNGWQDTIECLESLFQINYPNYNVILVDNDSNDDSIFQIKNYCNGNVTVESIYFEYSKNNKPLKIIDATKEISNPKKIIHKNKDLILIKNKENLGFAEGNNVGIKYAQDQMNSDYVLLLNNDTIVDPDFLSELISFADSDKNIGIVGPKVYNYGTENQIQSVGANLNLNFGTAHPIGSNKIDNGQYNNFYELDYVIGCCLLFKMELIPITGLLDKNYFLYWEETDFCLRAREKGYRCFYVYKSKIWHKHGASSENSTALYYFTRNTFYFIKKHGSISERGIYLVYFFILFFWYYIIIIIFRKRNLVQLRSFLKGVKDGLKIWNHYNFNHE